MAPAFQSVASEESRRPAVLGTGGIQGTVGPGADERAGGGGEACASRHNPTSGVNAMDSAAALAARASFFTNLCDVHHPGGRGRAETPYPELMP